MGGNYTSELTGIPADQIDLTKVSRAAVASVILKAVRSINNQLDLWTDPSVDGLQIVSGSSKWLFDFNAIDTDSLIKIKPKFGDIDLQCNKYDEAKLSQFLGSKPIVTGCTLIDYKKSGNQFITLWEFLSVDLNIQIDFELVDFNETTRLPTEWAEFAHSSSMEDLECGVKGVFHKYLIRAITTKYLREGIEVSQSGKAKLPAKVYPTVAFSVDHGIRHKYNQQLINGVLYLNKTKTPAYSKRLSDLFKILFGTCPTEYDLDNLSSFVGLIKLINKYVKTNSEKDLIIEGFKRLLYGPGAQSLYKDDKLRDLTEKGNALFVLESSIVLH